MSENENAKIKIQEAEQKIEEKIDNLSDVCKRQYATVKEAQKIEDVQFVIDHTPSEIIQNYVFLKVNYFKMKSNN